jgi:ribosomal protein S18 acetylase RimI-like enzyme
VAWRDVLGDGGLPDTIEASALESARFGLRMGRVVVPAGATCAAEDVVRLVEAADLDVTVVRYPADRLGWAASLARTGRTAFHADTLVYWAAPVGGGALATSVSAGSARRLAADDADLLDDLVADVFADYGSHYLANPLLDPAGALAGYQEWARRSLGEPGERAVALDDGSATYGVATIEVGDEVEILLAGVRASHRGRGLYRHVLEAVAAEAAAEGVEQLVISTQARNIGVQRAWARHGFLPVAAIETVHLVRAALLA